MIFFHLDVSDLIDLSEFKDKTIAAAKDALRDLSAQTHSHIVEQVQAKLHSTREKYLEALSFKQIDDDSWIINLDSKALWIEEGIEANHEMIDDLLKSPKAKTGKDGSRYAVIPFEHKKNPTASTSSQKSLTDTIKGEFKKRKIPYGKLELDGAGNPKKGLLHSFDIKNAPLKTAHSPGQGKGPIGKPMQGPTGIPFLQGVRVYQKEVEGPDGKMKVQKSIVTFRIVSSKHKGTGRWTHPGLEAKKFLDDAYDWAVEQWEQKIKKDLFVSIDKSF